MKLHKPAILRLAAESCRDPQTVQRVLAGKGTQQSRAAVIDAARRLGIPLPTFLSASVIPSLDDGAPVRSRAT